MTFPQPYGLWCGDRMIPDLLNAKPEEIDLEGLERNLWTAKRFSNCPDAFVVRQHTWLVEELARMDRQSVEVMRWARHHDDHEGVTGDMPGPLKNFINFKWESLRAIHGSPRITNPLTQIETALDEAIAKARGFSVPGPEVRGIVHHYDKMAETLEWGYRLKRPMALFGRTLPRWMSPKMADWLVEEAGARMPHTKLRELTPNPADG